MLECRGLGPRKPAVLAVLLLLSLAAPSCGDASFDLLPPGASPEPDAGVTGGTSSQGGTGGAGGGAPSPMGGSAGSTAGAAGTFNEGAAGAEEYGGAPPCWNGDCYPSPCPPFAVSCETCRDEHDCETQGLYCDQKEKRCVECRFDADCPLGKTCDPLTGACAESCTTSEQCLDDAPLCDQARGYCVQCTADMHCRTDATTPLCVLGRCVECFSEAHCSLGLPFCEGFRCVQCRGDFDCGAGGKCSPTGSCY